MWAYGQRHGTTVDKDFQAWLTHIKELSIQNIYIYVGNLTADGAAVQNSFSGFLQFPPHLTDVLTVVREFQDTNGDGQVTPNERLFNIYAWIRGSTDAEDLAVNPDAPQALYALDDPRARFNLALLIADLTYGSDVLGNNNGLFPDLKFDGVLLDIEPIPAASFADQHYPNEMPKRYDNFILLLQKINAQGVGQQPGIRPVLAVAVNPWTADANVTPQTFIPPLKYQWDSASFAGVSPYVDQLAPMAYEPFPLDLHKSAVPPKFSLATYDAYIETNLTQITAAASYGLAKVAILLPAFSNEYDPNLFGNFGLGLSGALDFAYQAAEAALNRFQGIGIFDEITLDATEDNQFRSFLANLPDSDRDGLDDVTERNVNSSPSIADTDGDGLSDYQEVVTFGTNPANPDTDGDGYSDGVEIASGTNPLDPTSHPTVKRKGGGKGRNK